MKKYLLTTFLFIILFGQAKFFGENDLLVVAFILITSVFLFIAVIKLHAGNRRMLRVNAQPDSWLHRMLSRDSTISMRVLAAVSSLILSTILIVLVKGMVLQQGSWAFFIVIIASSLFLYPFINANVSNGLIDRNIHQDISQHGNELARIFYAAIVLNLILSLAFSAYDTFEFKTSDIDIDNFSAKTVEVAVPRNPNNHFSRILINAYLLMDHVKIALAKQLVSLFDLQNNFYGFYVIIFALNMFKLFAFSFSFVLLQKGLEGAANRLTPIAKGVISSTISFMKSKAIYNFISKFWTHLFSDKKKEPTQ